MVEISMTSFQLLFTAKKQKTKNMVMGFSMSKRALKKQTWEDVKISLGSKWKDECIFTNWDEWAEDRNVKRKFIVWKADLEKHDFPSMFDEDVDLDPLVGNWLFWDQTFSQNMIEIFDERFAVHRQIEDVRNTLPTYVSAHLNALRDLYIIFRHKYWLLPFNYKKVVAQHVLKIERLVLSHAKQNMAIQRRLVIRNALQALVPMELVYVLESCIE